MLFPIRVRPNMYIVNDWTIDDGKQRSSKRDANAKHQDGGEPGWFGHRIAPGFPTTAVRQPTARIINGVCPVHANDLGRGVADHADPPARRLFGPSSSRFVLRRPTPRARPILPQLREDPCRSWSPFGRIAPASRRCFSKVPGSLTTEGGSSSLLTSDFEIGNSITSRYFSVALSRIRAIFLIIPCLYSWSWLCP